jgi:hypothetical protein
MLDAYESRWHFTHSSCVRPCYMAILYFEDGLDRVPYAGGLDIRVNKIQQYGDGHTHGDGMP